jgi:peptidoglycan hydrolase-like protein with peptidoglycan-binding domain
MHGQGTQEVSRNDMKAAEQALQAKGYSPGRLDGMADDAARSAIRSFQKDKGLPITGTIDRRTADDLGVEFNSRSSSHSPSTDPSSGRTSGRPYQ